MARHGVDLVSLIVGLLFAATGLLLLSGGIGAIPMEWAGPAVAIGLGVMILVAARPERHPEGESAAEDEA